jgi:hypothetical protein
VDDGQPGAARLFPGRHEQQGDQPSPDSPGLPGQDGGGSHGAQWHNGKLWIAALRPKLLLRVDPKTWVPEVAISTYTSPDKPRTHDLTIDDKGDIWLVLGNDSKNYKEGSRGW